jgi:hypothetical protein
VLRAAQDQLVMNQLLAQLTPRQIEVSAAELETFYRWRATQSRAQVIYTLDDGLAGAARAELDRGADFGAIADRFNFSGMLPPGGDIGFQTPGSMVNPLDDLIRTSPIGRVVGPVAAPSGGWFLVRVLERKPRAQEPFAAQEGVLRDMLTQRKQRSIMTRAYEELRNEYQMKLAPGGAAAMFRRYHTVADSGSGPYANTPPPTALEARQPLIFYNDLSGHTVTYTLGEAVADLRNLRGERPVLSSVPAIEQWIQAQALRRVAMLEAHRRRIDEDPAILRQVRQRADNSLLEAIYTTEVMRKAVATPADVQAMFALNAHRFIRLDAATLLAAMLPDSATGAKVMLAAPAAPGLREAVGQVAPGALVLERAVHFPSNEPTWNMLRPMIIEMNPHDYRGPYPVNGQWLVVQLLSKDQGAQTFEGLPPQIQDYLRNAAAEQARERRLGELTESLRRTLRPVIHKDRLARVPWPVPPDEGSGQS